LSPSSDRAVFVEGGASRQKEETLSALLRIGEHLAAQGPVLAVFEDVHWFDDLSLELLAREVGRAPRMPVMLLITARPEFAPAWLDLPHVTQLSLTRLDADNSAALVKHVASEQALADAEIRKIVARADGVPLFLEELTRATLVEMAKPRSRARGNRALRRAVPDALQGLLLARIDQLDPTDKAVLQRGAVVGRDFHYELLRLLEPSARAGLDSALDRLTGTGIVFRSGAGHEATYTFKHALLRDAAYGTLPRRRRCELHVRTARALEQHFADIAQAQPELLARHHTDAGANEAAAAYRLRAARKALQASAAAAAIAQARDGLRLIRGLPEDAARETLALRLYASLGAAFSVYKGYASREAGVAYAAALRLSHAAQDAAEAMRVLWGSWVHLHVRGRIEKAVALGKRIRATAERYGDPFSLLVADAITAQGAFYSGNPEDAAEPLDTAFPGGPDSEMLALYPIGFSVNSLVRAALACWTLGRHRRAAELVAQAETEARSLKHDFSLSWVLVWGSTVYLLRGEFDEAAPRLGEGIAVASRHGFSHPLGLGLMAQGWLIGQRGEPAEGIEKMRRGLEIYEATGARITAGYHRARLAELLLLAGRGDEASEMLDAAETQLRDWGECWHEPELYRIKAEILAYRADANIGAVEAAYTRAIASARRQNAIAWERRAEASRARWLADIGREQEAASAIDRLQRLIGVGEAADQLTAESMPRGVRRASPTAALPGAS
jgi:hypothetical protein